MKDVMLDLETMSTNSFAAIVSIGAVQFDKNGLGDKFYVNVDLKSCMDLGLVVDASTIQWWLQQSENARKDLFEKMWDLRVALRKFSLWLPGNPRIWGDGSCFDNVILGNAYSKAEIDKPWTYRDDRCYRTIRSIFSEIPMKRTGTHHNSCDDACSQALHLIDICNETGIDFIK